MRIVRRKQIERTARPIVAVESEAEFPVTIGDGDWSYAGTTGPEYWADLDPSFAICRDGLRQSPIDLDTPVEREAGGLAVDYRSIAPIRIVNDGVAINVPGVPSCAIELDGERFELQQLHFHHPAEHRIDGTLLDMELHLVHRSTQGTLAILAILARSGLEHEVLTPILTNLPQSKGEEIVIGGAFFPEDLLPPGRAHFRYSGSRTMPPCDEGVEWLVLTEPIDVSPAQIDAVAAARPFNARPIQPSNGREVRMFDPAPLRSEAV